MRDAQIDGQSGHWLNLPRCSRRNHLNLDQDMNCSLRLAMWSLMPLFRAGKPKRFYDTSRPYWWVRILYRNKTIRGWRGPVQCRRNCGGRMAALLALDVL